MHPALLRKAGTAKDTTEIQGISGTEMMTETVHVVVVRGIVGMDPEVREMSQEEVMGLGLTVRRVLFRDDSDDCKSNDGLM
jgi:hypothetical protein